MPIVPANGDVVARYSGGAANLSQAASLGGGMSTVAGGVIVTATLQNIFGNITGDQAAAGTDHHRCLYVVNNHATLTWLGVKAWISLLTDSPDDEWDIGLDPAAVGSDSAIVLTTQTEVPAGVTFTRPVTKATGLLVGDMAPGTRKAFWLRRDPVVGAGSYTANKGRFAFEGDSSA